MSHSKGWSEIGAYVASQQRTIHLQRSDKTEEKVFRFQRAANCEKVNI